MLQHCITACVTNLPDLKHVLFIIIHYYGIVIQY